MKNIKNIFKTYAKTKKTERERVKSKFSRILNPIRSFYSNGVKIILTSLFAALTCAGVIYAATTIGTNISTDGNLTVSGNATTTGIHYFGSNLGIGTSTPYAALSVVGEAVAEFFTATSTTATSTLFGGLNVGSGGFIYDFSSGNTTITGDLTHTGDLTVSGTIALPLTTTSSLGVITKSGERWLHDFQPTNTDGDANFTNIFLGYDAGNFTIPFTDSYHGTRNNGIGKESLKSLTTGYSNNAMGMYSMRNTTTGYSNSAIGSYSLTANTTGYANVGIGVYALSANTTGHGNVSISGSGALGNSTTGSNNISIGDYSLSAPTTANSEVAVGIYALSGFQGLIQNQFGSQTNFNTNWQGANWAWDGTACSEAGVGLHTAGNTAAMIPKVTDGFTVNIGDSYLVTYIVCGRTAGTVTVSMGGQTDTARSTNATFTFAFTATATTGIAFTPSSTFDGAIDIFTTLLTTVDSPNTAVGTNALKNTIIGTLNVALGFNAGEGTVTDTQSKRDYQMVFLGANASRDSSISTETALQNGISIGYGATVAKSNTVVLGNTSIVRTQLHGHINSTITTPTLASCGGGTPTITGTDTAGTVVIGTGSPTACSVVFDTTTGTPYTATPSCVVTPTYNATAYLSAQATTGFTVTFSAGAATSGFNYHCIGLE